MSRTQAQAIGTRVFLTRPEYQRLREMWCAARFGVGYLNHFGACAIHIDTKNEQREFDFHFSVAGERLPFQIAEVLDTGRRRGDEYRDRSDEQVAELHNQRPAQDDSYAARRVREELQAKLNKRYAGAESLHLLLYINLKASSVSWASLAEPAEHEARAFGSVWLVAQDVFCCIHGGLLWPELTGWRAVENASSLSRNSFSSD